MFLTQQLKNIQYNLIKAREIFGIKQQQYNI